MNHPPHIVEPDIGTDLVLVMDAEVNRVTVFARDDDDDVLTFQWFAPLDASTTVVDGSEGSLYYSSFSVERDPSLDGQEVDVVISDGLADSFATWTLQLPGSQR